MARHLKPAQLSVGVLLIASLLSWAAVKVLYVGVRQIPVGKVGSHKIVFCWTWNSWGSLIASDGRTGYYRIYDKEGQKVFELFSDTYAFDIVFGGEKKAEFQLDSGETKFWSPPECKKTKSEQAAASDGP